MRIALVSTPFVPVPPPQYGGTELIVAELAEGLVDAGHEVTLFTTGSDAPPLAGGRCEVRALYEEPVWPPDPYPELDHAGWAVEQIARARHAFDLVHAHVPAALPFAALLDVPMVYTVHHDREERYLPLYRRVADRVQLVAISGRQRALSRELSSAAVIHHGVHPARYPAGRGRGDYVAFLGRFAPEKGPRDAIIAARAARLPIRLAGRPHWRDHEYFASTLEPLLAVPGVDAIGEVGGLSKARFLGEALALAFPIQWEEPFGLVMIEAMLTGTPVVAYRRGSVPEVIDEGVTGFVVDGVEEMAARLAALHRGRFDRARCRARALERWSAARMVDDHLRLYQRCATPRLRSAVPVEPESDEGQADVQGPDAAPSA